MHQPRLLPIGPLFSLIRPLLLIVVSALLFLVLASADAGVAQAVTTSVGIDTDTTGNTAASLGPNDRCRSVAVNEVFEVDVWARDLDALAGWQAFLSYDSDVLEVVGFDGNFFLNVNDGSYMVDFSDPPPDSDGQFLMAVVDLGNGVQESGSGVLGRVRLQALQGGVSPLALSGILLLYLDGQWNVIAIGDVDGDDLFDGPTNGAIIWVGQPCPSGPDDADGDGVADSGDNCPDVGNPDQGDKDGDGTGDWCDDGDRDYILDAHDNCPNVWNLDQQDRDGDGLGDACDSDRDGDGVPNDSDNAPDVPNADQLDTDGDTTPDVIDKDVDGDGVIDKNLVVSAQADLDGDGDLETVQPSRIWPIGEKREFKLVGESDVHTVYVGVGYLLTTIEIVDVDGDTEAEISIKDFGQPAGQQQTFDITLNDPDTDIDIIVLGGGPSGRQAPPADIDGDSEDEALVWEPGIDPGQQIDTDLDGDSDPDVRWINGQLNSTDNCPETVNVGQANQDALLASGGASIPQDALGDACDDDDDNDGFADSVEMAIGTNPMDNCPTGPGSGGDSWPPDFTDDQAVNIQDVGEMRDVFNSPPNPNYDPRYDLNADGSINIIDIGALRPFFNQSCA